MTRDALIVTLDGPQSGGDGVRADDFARVLTAVSKAMHLMVAHLGGRSSRSGRWPDWVKEQSQLKLAPTRPGSFVAELTLDAPDESLDEGFELRAVRRRAVAEDIEFLDIPSESGRRGGGYGEQALGALREWNGNEYSTLPPAVTGCLYDAASHLSEGTQLWLGDNSMPRRALVVPPPKQQAVETATARLHGWLKAVNWDRRTARLYDSAGGYVPLSFRQQHDEEMRRLATQYVEVEGQGEINRQDKWTVVRVEELRETSSWSEPFDLDAFLKTPNPKRFVPAEMVTASEPFDAEEFNRTTREARDL